MKKTVSLILVLMVFALVFTACGADKPAEKKSEVNTVSPDVQPEKKSEIITVTLDEQTQFKMDVKDWNYALTKETMPDNAKSLAIQLEGKGAKLPLFALSQNEIDGLRIIAESTDMTNKDYLDLHKKATEKSIENATEGEEVQFGDTKGILWKFSLKGKEVTFMEFITKKGKYNLRISFWTVNALFETHESEYKEILNSIQF